MWVCMELARLPGGWGSCVWLVAAETGIHRLVRKSPFDSGIAATLLCGAFASLAIDDSIEVDINWRIVVDTEPASGAGVSM